MSFHLPSRRNIGSSNRYGPPSSPLFQPFWHFPCHRLFPSKPRFDALTCYGLTNHRLLPELVTLTCFGARDNRFSQRCIQTPFSSVPLTAGISVSSCGPDSAKPRNEFWLPFVKVRFFCRQSTYQLWQSASKASAVFISNTHIVRHDPSRS